MNALSILAYLKVAGAYYWRRTGGAGYQTNGKVLPEDERYVGHWNPHAGGWNGASAALLDGRT
jgi:hypothetical protein